MSGHSASRRLKTGLFLACVLTAGLGLAGCSEIDSMFGDESSDMSASSAPSPAGGPGAAVAPPTAEAAPIAGGSASALVATITPVTIEAGPDTGTGVNKTIQTLRGQMSGLE